jgi:hypothetical protein
MDKEEKRWDGSQAKYVSFPSGLWVQKVCGNPLADYPHNLRRVEPHPLGQVWGSIVRLRDLGGVLKFPRGGH